MFYPAMLVLKNYVPLRLSLGMLFCTKYFPDTEKEFTEIWPLETEHLEALDLPLYVELHGYPVKLSLIDDNDEEIAENFEIGWISDDPSKDLRELTIKDINKILQVYDGLVEVDVLEYDLLTCETITPRFVNQKVVIRLLQESYYDEDELNEENNHEGSNEN